MAAAAAASQGHWAVLAPLASLTHGTPAPLSSRASTVSGVWQESSMRRSLPGLQGACRLFCARGGTRSQRQPRSHTWGLLIVLGGSRRLRGCIAAEAPLGVAGGLCWPEQVYMPSPMAWGRRLAWHQGFELWQGQDWN